MIPAPDTLPEAAAAESVSPAEAGRTMADTTNAALQKNISRYITLWRRQQADVGGEDLLAMGLQPGPAFGRILEAVLTAKLDGLAATTEQQLELARTLARQADENSDTEK